MEKATLDREPDTGEAREPRLELAPHYAIPLEESRLHLRSATQSAVMRGPAVAEILPKLIPLLDGSRTRAQIAKEIGDDRYKDKVDYLLTTLYTRGLIQEVEEIPAGLSDEDLRGMGTLARYLGRNGKVYPTLLALRRAHVAIVNPGAVTPVLVSSLAHLGVRRISLVGETPHIAAREAERSRSYTTEDVGAGRLEALRARCLPEGSKTQLDLIAHRPATKQAWMESLEDVSMAVVLLDEPVLFFDWLSEFNAFALEKKLPWTSVALLDGKEIHIGPTIRPGVTACYKCFELRYKSNLTGLESYTALERHFAQGAQTVDMGVLPPVVEIAGGFASIEIMRAISPDLAGKTSGKLMVFDASNFECTYHNVLKVPRCPACGPARDRPKQRIWS